MKRRFIAILLMISVLAVSYAIPVSAADSAPFEKVLAAMEKKLMTAYRCDKPALKSTYADGTNEYYTYPPITDKLVQPLIAEYIKGVRQRIADLGELSTAETQRVMTQLSSETSASLFYWADNNKKVVLDAGYDLSFGWIDEEREKAAKLSETNRFFDNSKSKPAAWARTAVKKAIEDGAVPESLQENYQRPITLGEYVHLYLSYLKWGYDAFFQDKNMKVSILDDTVTDASPEDVKMAFVLGLINRPEELEKTMTREEAAMKFAALVSRGLRTDGRPAVTKDNLKIAPEAMDAVGVVLDGFLMNAINGNFEPKSQYTVEQAIFDLFQEEHSPGYFQKLRGLVDIAELNRASVVVGKNFIYLNFSGKKAADDYIHFYVQKRLRLYDTYSLHLEYRNQFSSYKAKNYDVPITGNYQKIDAGYGIIELEAPDYCVKYTFKQGLVNLFGGDDYAGQEFSFGRDLYKSEPRIVNPGEKVSMEVQPDILHKILYPKVDAILKTILKPGMTPEQKVTAIHDYVVTHIKYSGGPDFLLGEQALTAIENGKGVCVGYTMLFYHLCNRAGITVRCISGNSIAGPHTWNLVYISGKWLHVDTTFDDQGNKLSHQYLLKDTEYMLKTRYFQGFGVADPYLYTEIDPMKIQSTDELRAYLSKKIDSSILPKTISFRTIQKNIDTNVAFLRFITPDAKYNIKYDEKQNLYTLTKVISK